MEGGREGGRGKLRGVSHLSIRKDKVGGGGKEGGREGGREEGRKKGREGGREGGRNVPKHAG
jgi:hypothetical protein